MKMALAYFLIIFFCSSFINAYEASELSNLAIQLNNLSNIKLAQPRISKVDIEEFVKRVFIDGEMPYNIGGTYIEQIIRIVLDTFQAYKQNEHLSIVTIGSGEGHQDYILLRILLHFGYKNLTLTLIEPTADQRNYLTNLLKDAGYGDCFESIEECKITFNHYKWPHDYLEYLINHPGQKINILMAHGSTYEKFRTDCAFFNRMDFIPVNIGLIPISTLKGQAAIEENKRLKKAYYERAYLFVPNDIKDSFITTNIDMVNNFLFNLTIGFKLKTINNLLLEKYALLSRLSDYSNSTTWMKEENNLGNLVVNTLRELAKDWKAGGETYCYPLETTLNLIKVGGSTKCIAYIYQPGVSAFKVDLDNPYEESKLKHVWQFNQNTVQYEQVK